MVELIVFDVDGTLAKIYTLDLLPGVQAFFDLLYRGGCGGAPKAAIATNQGGVGLRYHMERDQFGRPKGYPTEAEIEERMNGLVRALAGDGTPPGSLRWYAAYRYKDRQGEWTPIPPDREDDPAWSSSWRKPGPGMLLQAMQDAGAAPETTLFVGDSVDDEGAAAAAGCRFAWADDFFSRSWTGCEDLRRLEDM